MNTKALYKLTWIMFICNIIIVLHHTNLGYYNDATDKNFIFFLMNFFSTIAKPAMSWFFFITAFWFFKNFKIEQLWNKLKRRFFSIFIPYIIWNTVAIVVRLLYKRDILSGGIWMFMRNTFIFYNSEGCANGPLWYLFRIMQFTLLTPLIFLLLRKCIGVPAILVSIVFLLFNAVNNIQYYEFTYFLPVYMLGAYLSNIKSSFIDDYLCNTTEKFRTVKIIASTLILIIGSYGCDYLESQLFTLIYRYLCIFLILYILHQVKVVKKPWKNIRGLGMYLYCSHYIVCSTLRVLILKLPIDMDSAWIILVIGSFSVLFFSWLFLDRFLPKTLRVIIGGR